MTPPAPPFDCARCRRRISSQANHHLISEGSRVVCGRCTGRDAHAGLFPGCPERWHDVGDHPGCVGTRPGIASHLGLWPPDPHQPKPARLESAAETLGWSPAKATIWAALYTIASPAAPATVQALVDWIADLHGHGLRRQTIHVALRDLVEDGLADYYTHFGAPGGKGWYPLPPGAPTARDLLEARECSPQCLLALGDSCNCQCRGRWHSALATAQINRSHAEQEQADRRLAP